MPVLFPHHYLVRPRAALDELTAHVAPRPWFAEPSVWMTMSAGDHEYEGQQAHAEQLVKLHVLTALHRAATAEEEPAEARTLATQLIATWPMTVETFDRFWELIPAGHFVHEASAEHARLVDLRAVVASPEPIRPAGRGALLWEPGASLARWWQDMIDRRIEVDQQLATALLWALERLRERFPAAVPDRRCRVHAARDTTMQTLEAAIDRSDWTRDPLAPLTIRLDSVQIDEIEFSFDITPAGAGRPHEEGQLRATITAGPDGWTVAEGALVLVTRTEHPLDPGP
jgi:hypothetical protein